MNRAFGYRSDQRKRSENQDCYGVFEFPGFTLAIVCDGMGGHVGGAQASTLAVRAVHEAMSNVTGNYGDALRVALERANQAIYEAARKNHRLMGMGTTAVAAVLVDDGTVHIAHVGDSRAYLINEGQAIQVTRDHTMVNLFVDAELLTPEDAATHPEAHVLSRSLGVERQVEVELSDSIELADHDVVFLCSDGVHGVVTDWELGSVDWSRPEAGVSHVATIVDAREGDDNATAVAVLIGGTVSMKPTPVPEPKSLEASYGSSAPAQGHTIIPEEDDYEPLSDPDSYRTEPSAPPREGLPAVTELDPEQPRTPVSGPRGQPEPAAAARTRPESPAAAGKKAEAEPARPAAKPAARRSGGSPILKMMLPIAALTLGGVVVLAAGFLFLRNVNDADETSEVVLNVEAPRPAGPVPGAAAPVPVMDTTQFFAPNTPTAPRRLPHRPLRYTQAPPNGAPRFQAVQAARDGKCSESLDAVRAAMKVSPDHAQLYSQAWFCFDEFASRPLAAARAQDWKAFRELEILFRGWPEAGEPEISWTAEDKRLPMWYRPALDGVEYRLEAWQRSGEDDHLRDVMVDLKGEPSVADDLAADVLIEAQAAVALSRATEREEALEEAWARRVYVVSSAMSGRIGKLLRTNRPELVPQIEELLAQATTRSEGGPAVPAVVAKALKVGMGDEPAPSVAPVRVNPVNPLPDEPDLGTGPTGGGGGTIHR